MQICVALRKPRNVKVVLPSDGRHLLTHESGKHFVEGDEHFLGQAELFAQKPLSMGIPGEGGESMLNIKTLLKIFEILGGIDTTLELCKKSVAIMKWIVNMVKKVVHKIRTATKK